MIERGVRVAHQHGFKTKRGSPPARRVDAIVGLQAGKVWAVLMDRLGYTRYVAQGGCRGLSSR